MYCSDNQLTSLDNLPYNLGILYCFDNNLTNLDNLPHNLERLYCYGNPLIYDFEPTLENFRKYKASKKWFDFMF